MAAYAALLSVIHTIDQIQHHPRPPISFDNEQVESLIQKVTFLRDFLDGYSHDGGEEAYALESRIAGSAYAAEDVIETHVVDQIHGKKRSSSFDFYQALQRVIVGLDCVKEEVMEIIKIKKTAGPIQDQQLPRNSMRPASSSRSPFTGQNTAMVGFEDVLNEIVDKLTGQQSSCEIIPIVGMSGIGKTTLARNIYVDPRNLHRFDILAWGTITQEYSLKEVLLEIIVCLNTQESKESLNQMTDYKLGEKLYKSLSGWRYLIILDDVWSTEAWDNLRLFFPINNNESRIVITTRLSNVAFQICGSYGIVLNFLDEDKSWNLLSENVFGEEGCSLELEKVGRKIAKNCKGLPLSIVVIGGLLAKSKPSREYWEYIARNLNSIVNLEDNERCLKILQLSYNQLPVHLKPCFLYMGLFPEDSDIRVSCLFKLWVAEGFLKPKSDKSLEVVAEVYLRELIDRNLIIVHKWGSAGKIKSIHIHDLLRDLCLREARRGKFCYVTRVNSLRNTPPKGINRQRRIGIDHSTRLEVLEALQYGSLARSVLCNFEKNHTWFDWRLLRVLKTPDKGSNDLYKIPNINIFFPTLVNSRFLSINVAYRQDCDFPPSGYLLWNLHTLIVRCTTFTRFEIWKMPQLRHVEIDNLQLTNPQQDDDSECVLENLQTLSTIRNFKCGEEVVKRIPNIKKLKVIYDDFHHEDVSRYYCLNNFDRLRKLESLRCSFDFDSENQLSGTGEFLQNITFPHSLEKLALERTKINWEDMKMMTKIGSLPHLRVLKLGTGSFIGHEWKTVEGQFCSLKFLKIDGSSSDLVYWITERTHFPRLEHLVLKGCDRLKEIPSCIGEIPRLQTIELNRCGYSTVVSAKHILDEQEELGNEGLQVRVILGMKDQELESLATANFQVEISTYY